MTDTVPRRITTGTLWAGMDSAVTILANLVLAAVFLHERGAHDYGVYLVLLLIGGPGLLTTFDLGMGATVTTFAARFESAERQRLPSLWTFSIAYYGVLSLVVVTLTWITSTALHDSVVAGLGGSADIATVGPAVLLLQVSTFFGVFAESFLRGLFDYISIHSTAIVAQAARLAGVWWLLTTGRSLAAVVAWTAACWAGRVVLLHLRLLAAHRGAARLEAFTREDVTVWGRYSLRLLNRSIAGLMLFFSDRVIIPLYMPVARLAEYDVASKPPLALRALLSILTATLPPAGARHAARGEIDELRRLIVRGSRFAMLVFIPPWVFFMIQMPELIGAWVGPGFERVADIARIYLASLLFAVAPAVADSVLLGMGEARRTVRPVWAAAVTNLAVTLALIGPFGLTGVVLGTLVSSVVSNGWLSAIAWRVFRLDATSVRAEVLQPSIVAAVASAIAAALATPIAGTSRLGFVCVALASIAISYAGIYAVLLAPNERRFIRDYVRSAVLRRGR